ncbi:hypothetical protein ABIB62_004454 [Mucilaginibacter sp. UYP25]
MSESATIYLDRKSKILSFDKNEGQKLCCNPKKIFKKYIYTRVIFLFDFNENKYDKGQSCDNPANLLSGPN